MPELSQQAYYDDLQVKLIAELNDKESLTRSELSAARVMPVVSGGPTKKKVLVKAYCDKCDERFLECVCTEDNYYD